MPSYAASRGLGRPRDRRCGCLLALVLGVAAGLLARRLGDGWGRRRRSGQLGQLWLNGLRMTLVPLVFCLMTAGVANIARTAAGGRVARVAVTVFLALLLVGSVLGVLTMLGLMRLWPVAALRVAAAARLKQAAPPSLLGEFVALVPSNPIAAAAEAAMAPLIVFAAVFGAAIARIAAGLDDAAAGGAERGLRGAAGGGGLGAAAGAGGHLLPAGGDGRDGGRGRRERPGAVRGADVDRAGGRRSLSRSSWGCSAAWGRCASRAPRRRRRRSR